MMGDSTTLLKKLLAAGRIAGTRKSSVTPTLVKPSPSEKASELLKQLLKAAPKTPRSRRKLTLLEGLEILDLEVPHSNFIAWLLDPVGPLTDLWLLRMLFERVAPDQTWPGTPIVEREVSRDGGRRVDIHISWNGAYQLLIENKIWSPESAGQVAAYLDDFGISSTADGVVLFLSPSGRRPRSVSPDDRRVVTMKYGELADLIDAGLAQGREPDTRGRIMAMEFRDCIHRLLKRGFDTMVKPELSEATKLYLAHGQEYAELKNQAIDESAEFLQWVCVEAGRRLGKILGPEMVMHPTPYGCLYRLPKWIDGQLQFGFGISAEADPRRRLISEHSGPPCIGVNVMTSDGEETRDQCKPISDRLYTACEGAWPHSEDLADPTYSWPLWRYLELPTDGDYDRWTEQLIIQIEEMVTKLSPILVKVADQLAQDK